MSDLNKLLMQLAKDKKSYADWQKERYPIVASHKNSQRIAEMELSRSQMRRIGIQKGE